ncbi:hypothetical protein PVAP13_6KG369106 [Panicum virgatum]|uniref:Uncharacterized protein n=1 Tax=Panicum virgatum TaxID=38727 RepID=A0A8T0RGJ9_PANVG|nr:hypothetical protein PVAP13_6KG369106 [Panicum virgatum]
MWAPRRMGPHVSGTTARAVTAPNPRRVPSVSHTHPSLTRSIQHLARRRPPPAGCSSSPPLPSAAAPLAASRLGSSSARPTREAAAQSAASAPRLLAQRGKRRCSSPAILVPRLAGRVPGSQSGQPLLPPRQHRGYP